MPYEGKSVFIGSIAFIIFAMVRNAVPLNNMAFFVVACAVFAGITILTYLSALEYIQEIK